jgi:hypothetical protein
LYDHVLSSQFSQKDVLLILPPGRRSVKPYLSTVALFGSRGRYLPIRRKQRIGSIFGLTAMEPVDNLLLLLYFLTYEGICDLRSEIEEVVAGNDISGGLAFSIFEGAR